MRARRSAPSDDRDALAELQVRSDDTASSLRHRALTAVLQVGIADRCGWYEPVMQGGLPCPGHAIFHGCGDDASERFFRRYDELPGTIGPRHSLRHLVPGFSSRFVRGADLWGSRDRLMESPFYEHVFEPLGFADQLRLQVFDGDCFVAYIGLYRGPREPEFSRADARRLHPLVRALRGTLVTAARLGDRASPEEGGDVLVRPDGRVAAATRTGKAWLDAEGVAPGLRALARDLEHRPDEAGTAIVGPARVEWTRLHGETTRYLVRLARSRYRRPRLARLTPRRREVAELLARGLRVEDVATALEISTHTAKRHVAAVYRSLDIAHRAELVRLLATNDEDER